MWLENIKYHNSIDIYFFLLLLGSIADDIRLKEAFLSFRWKLFLLTLGAGAGYSWLCYCFYSPFFPENKWKRKSCFKGVEARHSSLAGVAATFGIAVSPKLLPSLPWRNPPLFSKIFSHISHFLSFHRTCACIFWPLSVWLVLFVVMAEPSVEPIVIRTSIAEPIYVPSLTK